MFRINIGRALLACTALFAGGVLPIFMLLTSTSLAVLRRPRSMPEQMSLLHRTTGLYLRLVLLPGLALLGAVTGLSLKNFPSLANRIFVGALAGALATIGLDAVRLWGYSQGYMPANMPKQFGRMITGPMGSAGEVRKSGYAYHFLNGMDFGIVYAIIVGPAHWLWGVVWGLVVWVLMMTTPPMLMSGSGPFLYRKGPGPSTVALGAHIIMGTIIGTIVKTLARPKGNLLDLLRERRGRGS